MNRYIIQVKQIQFTYRKNTNGAYGRREVLQANKNSTAAWMLLDIQGGIYYGSTA